LATPETSQGPLTGPKKALQVVLAGALGLTAGTVLWEIAFLPESSFHAARFAGWIGFMLLGGSITFAWTRGVARSPQRAAKFGAVTGIIMAAIINAALWMFEGPADELLGEQIDLTLLGMLQWGFYGFFGGLAIEKCWGRRSAVRIAFGLGVACLAAAFFHASYTDSLHSSFPEQFQPPIFNAPPRQRPFSDPGFWMYELMYQLVPAAGWALAFFLLRKSSDVFQRQPTHGDSSTEIEDVSSRKETTKIPAFKDRFETSFVATIGVTAGLIFSGAIFTSGMFSWNFVQWMTYLFAIGFALLLNFRYLDPFLEELGGSDEHTLDSGSRFRKVSLLSISAAVPITIFMQLNDKVMMENPVEMVLWAVAAFGGGAITFAWACGSYRSPRRTAEFGALTGAILPSLAILGIYSYAIMLGRRTVDQAVALIGGAALEWGLYGLVGGLLIERGRGTWLPKRVASGIVIAGLIIIVGLTAASIGAPGTYASIIDVSNRGATEVCAQSLQSKPVACNLLPQLARVFFIALGWAWGLMLFPKSEDVLRTRSNSPS
jgi:hypothetical protein